jgi:hypothetical protein
MHLKSNKVLLKLRRFGLILVAVIAAVGGVTVNLSSIIDLYERFTGQSSASTEANATISIAGRWQADVIYDWGAKHTEVFDLRQFDREIRGAISYLGSPRGITEGKVNGNTVMLVLKTQEVADTTREVRHEYVGTVDGNEIRFVLSSMGGHNEHSPVEFTAKRLQN